SPAFPIPRNSPGIPPEFARVILEFPQDSRRRSALPMYHMAAKRPTAVDRGGSPMAPRGDYGTTLSAQRAFVLHLGMSGRRRRRRFSGWGEHLSAGESTHFSSLKGLLQFFGAVLDAGPCDADAIQGATSVAPPRRVTQSSGPTAPLVSTTTEGGADHELQGPRTRERRE